MSVRLLLTPAVGGKTAHAISRIRELRVPDGLAELVASPFSPVCVVLPNFSQAAAFRRRLARAGGALGVEVGTFYGLYSDILAGAGMPAPRLFGPVQHRLLRAIVDRLCEEGRLQYYAPLRDKPGFVRALRTLIQELKRARVHRDGFTAAVADQPARLAELAAVYAAYQDWLVTSGWTDAEGQGWLAARALERDPALYADLLADRAAETLITLTGDAANPGRTAHRRFARARAALTAALPNLKSETLQPGTAGPYSVLRSLENCLFEPLSTAPLPVNGAVEFIEAQDRRQEVRAALRWLKARIVHDGMDAGEIALLARDLSPYLPFLEETAAEFGMVLHLAVGSDLASNPAVAALLSALSLAVLDWPRRPVIEALANPYLDWSALLAEAAPEGVGARLDAVARAGLVIQGLDQWHEVLDQLAPSVDGTSADKGVGAAGEEEDVASSDLPAGEEAAALRRAFERLVERLTPEPQATVRDYVAWVEGIVGDDPALAYPSSEPRDDDSLRIVSRVREAEGEAAGRPFARRDIAALQAFKDVLRGLVLSESLLEQRPSSIPYARFFSELHGAVGAATYTLPPPEEADRASQPGSVLVAPVLHARGLSFRAIALLGLSEGEFPVTERDDPFLRESERALLRERGLVLEPRLRGEEVTLFYEAVTRARELLLLCRPYLADDGQAWGPSPYWRHVQRLVEDSPVRRVRPAELSLEKAASPQEFLTAAAQAGLSTVPVKAASPIDRGWRAALAGAAVVQARLARSPVGPYEGELGPLADILALRYGSAHVWSSSRLETYAKCPLHFYVAHVLHLEPRALPQEGFDRLILGSIYHEVLEKAYRLAPSEPLSALPEVAQEVFVAAPEAYGFRPTPLWEQQQREFLRVLEKNIVALEEARAGYEPYAQEPPFGLHGYPPLTLRYPASNIQYPETSIRIRGYIDRVDRAPDGSLRVIDYKAGSSRISARELEEGTRLQLPLYALAVRDALGLGSVVDGFYWHVGSASPSYLRLERYEGGVEGAAEAAVGYVEAYVGAVREGRFAPTPPSGGCPDHCPAVGFCWRYVARGW
jgi:hypothetical protein